MPPKVSVIMPVYNAERFVIDSVQSILQQTWTDFELIILDDSSTDTTPQLLAQMAGADSRIRLVRNSSNLGVTRTLNIGMREARGEFIARMDADDIALPDRLEKQLAYLEVHQEVGVLGGGCKVINEQGEFHSNWMKAEEDLAIRWEMLLDNPFIHPTVMLRKALLEKDSLQFDETLYVSQDYDFWTRLLQHTSGANLPTAVLLYRVHQNQITHEKRDKQHAAHAMISQRVIRDTLSMELTLSQVKALCDVFVFHGDNLFQGQVVISTVRVYLDIVKVFRTQHQRDAGIYRITCKAVLAAAKKALEQRDYRKFLIFTHPMMLRVSYLPAILGWSVRRTTVYRSMRTLLRGKQKSG